jgi:hypothetical protein
MILYEIVFVMHNTIYEMTDPIITEQEVNTTTILRKNKKKSNLTIAKLYDNMISASYTMDNGDLNKEKIEQQSYSFTKK